MKTKILGLLAVGLLGGPMAASAANYTEDFEAAFPAWESGWFGANSDARNFYCVARPCAERGNNPDGLWLGGLRDGSIQVSFIGGFGSTISSLGIDVAGFTPTILFAYDMSDNLIFVEQIVLTFGAYTDPGTYERYVINSANGISRFGFLGTQSQSAGNTSIDNIVVTTRTPVPEPGSLALLGLGLAGLGLSRRRKI